jgi:hypothetical protein
VISVGYRRAPEHRFPDLTVPTVFTLQGSPTPWRDAELPALARASAGLAKCDRPACGGEPEGGASLLP